MAERKRRLIVVRKAFLELGIRYVDLDSKSTCRMCVMGCHVARTQKHGIMVHVL